MEVKDLKPELLWKCFDEVTKIPRPSCHEEKIREFLVNFANEHGIEVKTDKVGNVVMRKAATPATRTPPASSCRPTWIWSPRRTTAWSMIS